MGRTASYPVDRTLYFLARHAGWGGIVCFFCHAYASYGDHRRTRFAHDGCTDGATHTDAHACPNGDVCADTDIYTCADTSYACGYTDQRSHVYPHPHGHPAAIPNPNPGPRRKRDALCGWYGDALCARRPFPDGRQR